MSDHTVSSLNSSTRKLFSRWLPHFERQKRAPGVLSEFEYLTKAGCEDIDLKWVLFYAAMSNESALEAPERIREFFLLLNDVLWKTLDLGDALVALLDLPMGSGTALGSHLGLFSATEKEKEFILKFPPALAALYRNLDRIRKIKAPIRTYAPATASKAETLLWIYVTKASRRKVSIRQVSILLEAACQAYGVEGRQFSEEAVAQRLKRFRRRGRDSEFAELTAIVDAFLASRLRGESVDLIPWFYHCYALWLQELTAELVRQGHFK